MSSPYEQLVVDALDRIERKCDAFSRTLQEHTESDRHQFMALESTVDLLATDLALRKKAAEEAGHAAGATAGKFWAIIGTIVAAMISGLTAAAR